MDTTLLIQQILEAILAVLSSSGNALVLYVIARHKAFHTVTNYLIGSLAMADFLVGAVGIPIVMVNNMGLPHEFYSCLFMNCVIVILTQISIFSLLLIALERYTAVKFPVIHRHHMRGGVLVSVAIASAWILGSIVGLVPMFGWHPPYNGTTDDFVCAFLSVIDMEYMVYFNFFGFVLTPIIAMFILYGCIYYVVRSRLRTKQKSPKSSDVESSNKLSKESKASMKIFLILVFFTISWLPLHIINTVLLFTDKTSFPVMLVGILLSHANSAMNPFLYALTNKKYNEAFKRALGIKKNLIGHGELTIQGD